MPEPLLSRIQMRSRPLCWPGSRLNYSDLEMRNCGLSCLEMSIFV